MYQPSRLERDHIPPTPAEVREIIKSSGLPAYRISQLMGVSRQTMWVWTAHGSMARRNKPMTWQQAHHLLDIAARAVLGCIPYTK